MNPNLQQTNEFQVFLEDDFDGLDEFWNDWQPDVLNYANPAVNIPTSTATSAPPGMFLHMAPSVTNYYGATYNNYTGEADVQQQQQPLSMPATLSGSSVFKKISAALPPAPLVIAAPVTNTVMSTPVPKASDAVVGVISAYTNAIQNKRKRDEVPTVASAETAAAGNSSSSNNNNNNNSSTNEETPTTTALDEEHLYQQEQKRIRLEVFDPIMDAFNTGDFDSMIKLVRNSCHDEVRLKLPTSATSTSYSGVTPILIFFGLLHETYPDAMTKILEKRISSTTSTANTRGATASRCIQSTEYVYKFHGTRITTKPVMESFVQIMNTIGHNGSNGQLQKELSHDEIVSVIGRQMTSIPPQAFEENECSFIAETILTFDEENKITEWAYDILASDVR